MIIKFDTKDYLCKATVKFELKKVEEFMYLCLLTVSHGLASCRTDRPARNVPALFNPLFRPGSL